MLRRLAISNLATIDSITLECAPGFTVLTGETGAGKSILIEGLRFVLGGRGSADQVRSGAPRTLVEAEFDLPAGSHAGALLASLDIPADGTLNLRRMLGENGRSRALANDCVISQTKLEELGNLLVNIHGQHDNQQLLTPATHVDFLDAHGNLLHLRGEVARLYNRYAALLARRREHQAHQAEQQARMETLRETVEALRAAELKEGEAEELAAEHRLLANAEQLAALLSGITDTLYEGDHPVLATLRETEAQLTQARDIDPALEAALAQMPTLRLQVEDIYQTVRGRLAQLEGDPGRLDWINARLATLEQLQRRYATDVPGLMTRLEADSAELARLEDQELEGEGMEREVSQLASELHSESSKLSAARAQAAQSLEAAVQGQLQELGMEKARFQVRMEPLVSPSGKTPSYSVQGMDKVEFQLSANPGQDPRPLARIASGGELSRTMLALKTVLAAADPTTTLIFDEVDAGISGRMAEIVGRKLRALGNGHQVLCVTHLPQIAALGAQHVLVEKTERGGHTFTSVAHLDDGGQVREVARLLSGIDISDSSLAAAREMVQKGRAAGT